MKQGASGSFSGRVASYKDIHWFSTWIQQILHWLQILAPRLYANPEGANGAYLGCPKACRSYEPKYTSLRQLTEKCVCSQLEAENPNPSQQEFGRPVLGILYGWMVAQVLATQHL